MITAKALRGILREGHPGWVHELGTCPDCLRYLTRVDDLRGTPRGGIDHGMDHHAGDCRNDCRVDRLVRHPSHAVQLRRRREVPMTGWMGREDAIMPRTWFVVALFVCALLVGMMVRLPAVRAEQPLTQLPDDVASLSFAWVALPQTMAEVTEEQGPLAGVTWGLVKGSSDVMERVVSLTDSNASFERSTQTRPPQTVPLSNATDQLSAWMNGNDGSSHQPHQESAWLRYAF